MERRLELHALLVEVLGSENVYYQPPANISMQYPAIVYGYDSLNNQHADNSPYRQTDGYQITLIHRNPDNEVKRAIGKLPMSRFERAYAADNLNHYIFSLYF